MTINGYYNAFFLLQPEVREPSVSLPRGEVEPVLSNDTTALHLIGHFPWEGQALAETSLGKP